jgi:small subunit ribosomal protein S6
MSKQNNQLYEGMFILSATLSDDARQKALDKITSGIVEKKGEIKKIHDLGRKKLTYQINGKKEGHYYVIYFSAPSKSISELWRDYHLNEDLIRFMTLVTHNVLEKIEFKPLPQE